MEIDTESTVTNTSPPEPIETGFPPPPTVESTLEDILTVQQEKDNLIEHLFRDISPPADKNDQAPAQVNEGTAPLHETDEDEGLGIDAPSGEDLLEIGVGPDLIKSLLEDISNISEDSLPTTTATETAPTTNQQSETSEDSLPTVSGTTPVTNQREEKAELFPALVKVSPDPKYPIPPQFKVKPATNGKRPPPPLKEKASRVTSRLTLLKKQYQKKVPPLLIWAKISS